MKWNLSESRSWKPIIVDSKQIPHIPLDVQWIPITEEYCKSLEAEIEEALNEKIWKVCGRYAPRMNGYV